LLKTDLLRNCLKTPLSWGEGLGVKGSSGFFAGNRMKTLPLIRPSATLSPGRGFENSLSVPFGLGYFRLPVVPPSVNSATIVEESFQSGRRDDGH